MSEASKRLREWYIQQGICTYCGQEKSVKGKKMCANCLDKEADRKRKQRKKLTAEQQKTINLKKKEYYKAVRQQRAEKELCLYCGKRKAITGKTICEFCKAKRKIKQKLYYRKCGTEPHEVRLMPGICYLCKQPALPQRKVCQNCYDRLCKISKMAKRDNSNHPWRQDANIYFLM